MATVETTAWRVLFNETDYVTVRIGARIEIDPYNRTDPANPVNTTGGVFPDNRSPLDPDPHRKNREILARGIEAVGLPAALDFGITVQTLADFNSDASIATLLPEGCTVRKAGTIVEVCGQLRGIGLPTAVDLLPAEWSAEKIP